MCGLQPCLKVPENIEVSMRQKEGTRVFFLLNPPEFGPCASNFNKAHARISSNGANPPGI